MNKRQAKKAKKKRQLPLSYYRGQSKKYKSERDDNGDIIPG